MPGTEILSGRFTFVSQNSDTLVVQLNLIIDGGNHLKEPIPCEIPGYAYEFFLALEQHHVYLGHPFHAPQGAEQPEALDIITINGVRRSIFAIDTTIQTLVAYLQLAPNQRFSPESIAILKRRSDVLDLLGRPQGTLITEDMLSSLFGNTFEQQRPALIQKYPYPSACMRLSFGDASVWLAEVLKARNLDEYYATRDLAYETHIPKIGQYTVEREGRLVPAVPDETWGTTAMTGKITVYSQAFMKICYANIKSLSAWLGAASQKMQSLPSETSKVEFLYCLESAHLPYDPALMPIDQNYLNALIFNDNYLLSSIFRMLCRYEATTLFLSYLIHRDSKPFYEKLRRCEGSRTDEETRELFQVMGKNLYNTPGNELEKLRFALDFYAVLEPTLREKFFERITEERLLQAIYTSSHDNFCTLVGNPEFATILENKLSQQKLADLIVFGWSQVAFNQKKPVFFNRTILSCGLPAFITALELAPWVSQYQVDSVCMPLKKVFEEHAHTDDYARLNSTHLNLKNSGWMEPNPSLSTARPAPTSMTPYSFWPKPDGNNNDNKTGPQPGNATG